MNNSTCLHCSFKQFCHANVAICERSGQHSIVSAKHQLRRNEVLCLPNAKFKSLYIIESGALKAYQVDKQGNEYIQGFYFAGEVVGYKAIFYGHYLSTIVALKDTTVCEVHYNEFLSLLRQQPNLYEDVLLSLSKKLSDDACVNVQSAERRVAMFLIDLSRRMLDAEPDIKLEMPMTREDAGHYLNLTAETVSRILTRFQRDKIITVDRRTVFIHNPDRLKKIAE